MDYQDGKRIIEKLEAGLQTGVPAQFTPREAGGIRNLIDTEMVSPQAFARSGKHEFDSQNLTETLPVTSKGKQLFR